MGRVALGSHVAGGRGAVFSCRSYTLSPFWGRGRGRGCWCRVGICSFYRSGRARARASASRTRASASRTRAGASRTRASHGDPRGHLSPHQMAPRQTPRQERARFTSARAFLAGKSLQTIALEHKGGCKGGTIVAHMLDALTHGMPVDLVTHPCIIHPSITHPIITHPSVTHPSVTHPCIIRPIDDMSSCITHLLINHPLTHPSHIPLSLVCMSCRVVVLYCAVL